MKINPAPAFFLNLRITKFRFHKPCYCMGTLFSRTLQQNLMATAPERARCFAISAEYATFAVTYRIHGKCSLFSSDERRKFDRRENRRTSCRVVSIYGYRRGAVAYFIFEVSTTSLTKISFRHHAFCFIKSKH